MANIVLEGTFIEIDKFKKYVIVMDSEKHSLEEIAKISTAIQNWLSKESDPIVVLYGAGIRLLEAEKDE